MADTYNESIVAEAQQYVELEKDIVTRRNVIDRDLTALENLRLKQKQLGDKLKSHCGPNITCRRVLVDHVLLVVTQNTIEAHVDVIFK